MRGESTVPGDKSVAHRWLMLAATAEGTSVLAGVPRSLDVQSTVRALREMGASIEPAVEPGGFHVEHPARGTLEVRGRGRLGLRGPSGAVDCGNSGTTMRLLAGLLAPVEIEVVLDGDPSLRARPMERVAGPLRRMGATVSTRAGHAPIALRGGDLEGISFEPEVASAQVKGAVLLAGTAAAGETLVREKLPTRDHTERALEALGVSILRSESVAAVSPGQHSAFEGILPGDPSAAAFLVVGAVISGGAVSLSGVGLNPTRVGFVDILRRMGARVETVEEWSSVGEPAGRITATGGGSLRGVSLSQAEVAAAIDEIPVLALAAAHAEGESRFEGAAELRVKESDRLAGVVAGIRALGGEASVDRDALVIGGGGLRGGQVHAHGDHRMAMAFATGALAARGPSSVAGMESADVSFPGFVESLRGLGLDVEPS
jgi:3-phosphoshikimate 1-carboxyvinyltransferase